MECSVADKKRYLVLVTTISRSDAEESVILGVDIRHDHCDLGLVMPLWSDMHITSLGDGSVSKHIITFGNQMLCKKHS